MHPREAISLVLAFYDAGLASSDEVVAWADAQIRACEQPDPLLFDLSLEGPRHCLRRPVHEFPLRPTRMSFAQRFAARALVLSPDDDAAGFAFLHWATVACMGEDLDEPLVNFSHLLDHHLNDLDDAGGALRELREGLPVLIPHCRQLWPYSFEDICIA